jgi:hypothetical protein
MQPLTQEMARMTIWKALKRTEDFVARSKIHAVALKCKGVEVNAMATSYESFDFCASEQLRAESSAP